MSEETTNTQVEPDQDGDWSAVMEEQIAVETKNPAAGNRQTTSAYETAKFQDLENGSGASSGNGAGANLDVILDIPVTLSMEIGRTELPIQDLLQLNQGSVVELDRLAGEPMDVLINGTLIAHGEVVVVNEKFGIRLTDVISPSERVRKLR
jgi:flagellar motor switch protein FliN/FliY